MLQATRTRCIVQRITTTETAAGIILQRDVNTNPECVVISRGPKVMDAIQVGSRILVDWGRVGKFSYEDKEFFIVEESNILGVFE